MYMYTRKKLTVLYCLNGAIMQLKIINYLHSHVSQYIHCTGKEKGGKQARGERSAHPEKNSALETDKECEEGLSLASCVAGSTLYAIVAAMILPSF